MLKSRKMLPPARGNCPLLQVKMKNGPTLIEFFPPTLWLYDSRHCGAVDSNGRNGIFKARSCTSAGPAAAVEARLTQS